MVLDCQLIHDEVSVFLLMSIILNFDLDESVEIRNLGL